MEICVKSNFDEMSSEELRAYILEHRDDLDAMEAFFARRSPDEEAVWFLPPQDCSEWMQQMEDFHLILNDPLKEITEILAVILKHNQEIKFWDLIRDLYMDTVGQSTALQIYLIFAVVAVSLSIAFRDFLNSNILLLTAVPASILISSIVFMFIYIKIANKKIKQKNKRRPPLHKEIYKSMKFYQKTVLEEAYEPYLTPVEIENILGRLTNSNNITISYLKEAEVHFEKMKSASEINQNFANQIIPIMLTFSAIVFDDIVMRIVAVSALSSFFLYMQSKIYPIRHDRKLALCIYFLKIAQIRKENLILDRKE
jgi:hypothetical protein